MENRSHALATGGFILLLGLALIGVIAWFQGSRDERVFYTVVSKSGVPGLNVKAAVKLQGVEIGKVETIDFDPAVPRQILVKIRVTDDAPITTATFARLGYQGITGLSFIDLAEDEKLATADGKTARLPEDSRIELRPSLLDQLSSGGPRLLLAVNEVAERINVLLGDENQQQLTRAMTNLADASADIGALARELKPLAGKLVPLTAQADRTLVDARTTLQRFDALAIESTQVARDLRERAKVLDQVGQAATQLQTTAQRIEAGLVGSGRPRTQPLVDELGQAARALERAATELGEQPQSVLFGRTPPPAGPGESGFDPAARAGKR